VALLIPLGLLVIGAGLLAGAPLQQLRSVRSGPCSSSCRTTLTGIAVLGAGASILVGWAWNIYDPQAFSALSASSRMRI